MALKNRNPGEAGRLRVQVACPNCGGRCLVRGSDRKSRLTRLYYVACRDHLCGWRGLGMFEIVKTTHPPPDKVRQGAVPDLVSDDFFDNPPEVDDGSD